MGDMWTVGRKKLKDTFSSRKFLLIFGLFVLMSMASVYTGFQSYEQQMDQFRNGNSYGPAPEKPSLIDVFQPMVGFNLPLAASVLALMLSYSSISREREEGTIELLLSYPLYRDEVINGKFVAGLFTVSLALLIAFIASSGLAIYLTGILPTLQELFRLMFMWQGSVVYMAFFFGLGTLFSVIFRSSRRSLIAGIAFLLLFLVTPFAAGLAANLIYPMDVDSGGMVSGTSVASGSSAAGSMRVTEQDGSATEKRREIRQKREAFQDQVSRISPTVSYRNFVTTMLGTDYESESGLKPGVWESLGSAIGYLVFLLSETMLVFATSYAVFMRQDL